MWEIEAVAKIDRIFNFGKFEEKIAFESSFSAVSKPMLQVNIRFAAFSSFEKMYTSAQHLTQNFNNTSVKNQRGWWNFSKRVQFCEMRQVFDKF